MKKKHFFFKKCAQSFFTYFATYLKSDLLVTFWYVVTSRFITSRNRLAKILPRDQI